MSSVPFEEQRSVWTYNHAPAWTDNNGGIADMRLVDGLSDNQANSLCERLLLLLPNSEFEVWDIYNNVVREFKNNSFRVGPKYLIKSNGDSEG